MSRERVAGGRLASRRPLEAVKNPDTRGEKTLTAARVGRASSLRSRAFAAN